MELSSLWALLGDAAIDDFLVWGVMLVAVIVAVVAGVNALDSFLEAEAG